MEVIMDMEDILTWHRNQSNVFSNELFIIFFLSSLEKVSIGALMKRIGTISTLRSSVTQVRPPGFDTRELAGHSRSYGLLWKAWTNDPGVRVSSKFRPSELFVDLHIIGPTPDRASAISRIYQHQPEKRRRNNSKAYHYEHIVSQQYLIFRNEYSLPFILEMYDETLMCSLVLLR